MTEQQREGNAEHISLLADGLALVYHEARHVRFLISAAHLPDAGWERLISLPKNRVEAWRMMRSVRVAAASRPRGTEAARLFETRFRKTPEDLQLLYADSHWKHGSAVGGHAWRAVTSSVIALLDAIDHGPSGTIDAACARLLAVQHNNGLLRDKIVELDNAIEVATNPWWNKSSPGA